MVMSCLDLDLPESSTNARFWRPAPARQHENSSKWSYTTDQIMRMNIQIMCQAFFDLRRLGRLSKTRFDDGRLSFSPLEEATLEVAMPGQGRKAMLKALNWAYASRPWTGLDTVPGRTWDRHASVCSSVWPGYVGGHLGCGHAHDLIKWNECLRFTVGENTRKRINYLIHLHSPFSSCIWKHPQMHLSQKTLALAACLLNFPR